ncbi:hypothetical protein CR513_46582, partial [Mucuna pruriens]
MGACLSKKKGSSTCTSSTVPELKNPSASVSGVAVSKPKVETAPEVEVQHESVVETEGHVKKEIFIIKHRKSHDDRDRNSNSNSNSKFPPCTTEAAEPMCDKTAPAPPTNMGGVVGVVRTSSCTKEEVDAILIHCGRLSRSSSGNAVAASGEHKRRYSGSKRSYDFDHCDNDTISNDEDSKKGNDNNCDLFENERHQHQHQHRPRHRHSPSPRPSSQERRRRTPSREREQQQRSSSRERRVSRSPGKRSSDNNTTPANARNNNSNTSSRPGKMVSVPATVSSLVMDKSNNNGGGGGESAATTAIKRIAVKRNAGAASPRSQSPARANGNAVNASKAFNENQQPSLSRNSSRKAEQSPYKRNPLSEIEPNTLAFPYSTANNSSSRVQNKPKKDFETEANQKTNGSRTALDKGMIVNCKTKVQQEEEVKVVQSSITDNIVVKTVVPPGVDNLKPHTLTRSRSSRRSRDLDLNPEALLNPPQSYTSLLLEDIQNFHQKSTPVSLPACVTKACSILEAVADLNSNTSLNFCGAEDRRSPPAFQCSKNDYNVVLSANDYGTREPDAEDPVVESMLVVNDDDMMEPSLHKYVTVNRGGGVDLEDQESSGSNSFTVSSAQQHWGISSSSWEPSSVESKDCWTSRLNYAKEEGQKSTLGLEERVACDVDGARKKLNGKRRECDHQHGSGIGRGRLGTASAST